MNKPTRVAMYVIVALLSGFGLWQAGSAAATYGGAIGAVVSSGVTRDELIFLRQAKYQNDQQVAQQKAQAAAKAAAPKAEGTP